MDYKLKCKSLNYNSQEKNIRVNLHNLELGNGFLDITKEKNKLDHIKIKNFYRINDTIKKVKR